MKHLIESNESIENILKGINEGNMLDDEVTIPSPVQMKWEMFTKSLGSYSLKKPQKTALIVDMMSNLGISQDDLNQYLPKIKKYLGNDK